MPFDLEAWTKRFAQNSTEKVKTHERGKLRHVMDRSSSLCVCLKVNNEEDGGEDTTGINFRTENGQGDFDWTKPSNPEESEGD